MAPKTISRKLKCAKLTIVGGSLSLSLSHTHTHPFLSLQPRPDGHSTESPLREDTAKGRPLTNSAAPTVSTSMRRRRWSLLTVGITASWNGSGVTPVVECWPVATGEETDRISRISRQMCSSTVRRTVSSSAIGGIDEWHGGRVKVAHEAEKQSSTTSLVSDWPWTTRDLSTSLT